MENDRAAIKICAVNIAYARRSATRYVDGKAVGIVLAEVDRVDGHRQHRSIVATGDGHRDAGLGPVGTGDRERLDILLAGHELVVGRVHGVGPGAVTGDGEGAVEASRAGLGNK